jgi:hypothetical protein
MIIIFEENKELGASPTSPRPGHGMRLKASRRCYHNRRFFFAWKQDVIGTTILLRRLRHLASTKPREHTDSKPHLLFRSLSPDGDRRTLSIIYRWQEPCLSSRSERDGDESHLCTFYVRLGPNMESVFKFSPRQRTSGRERALRTGTLIAPKLEGYSQCQDPALGHCSHKCVTFTIDLVIMRTTVYDVVNSDES